MDVDCRDCVDGVCGGEWNKDRWWKSINADAAVDTADEKWHHYALTYSTTDGVAKLYIDGKEKGMGKAPNKNKIQVTETDLHIGNKSNLENTFSGPIDDVAVFSVALTEDDINAIMTQGLSRSLAVELRGQLAITWGAIKAR